MTAHTMTIALRRSEILTANQRLHWAAKARTVSNLRAVGATEAIEQRVPVMDRAHLTVWVSWPDRRRRDVSNLAPSIKALVDGVVQDAQRLPDDDDRHLIGPDMRVTNGPSGLDRGVVLLRFEWEELS